VNSLIGGPVPDLLVDSPEEGVTRITFNRPETLNAFTNATLEEFFLVLGGLRTDFSTRVVVLTGAGRAFSSGHDHTDHSTPSWLADDLGTIPSNLVQQRWWAQVVPTLRSLPQPVVAAVNGPVAGGGYAIALGADLRLAGRSARFVNAFHTLGATGTELGVAFLLQRAVGPQHAAEIMLTDRRLDADEAAALGLVLRVVPDDELETATLELCRRILAMQPLGAWLTKSALWAGIDGQSLESAIELEARGQILALATGDAAEHRRAKEEGRAPRYRWR
jgi:enoyl-CoA hydratase